MKSPHHASNIFSKLIEWAEQRDSIRAVLLTSTRAVPNAPVDEFSDYDMKHVYLRPMLEWLMGLHHNWSLPTGSLGKGKHVFSLAWLWG